MESGSNADRTVSRETLSLESGEQVECSVHTGTLDIEDVHHGAHLKSGCDRCPTRGTNLACPPHSPTLADLAPGASALHVLCVRIPVDTRDSIRIRFCAARNALLERLASVRSRGGQVAGSGPCTVCPRCAALDGQTVCRLPQQRIYSLESLGIDVSDLVQRAVSIRLAWESPEFVCAVGAEILSERARIYMSR